MNYFAAIIIFIILLPNSCGKNGRPSQGQNTATKSTALLNPQILPPDPSKYREVRDSNDWRNPFLVINRDGVLLRAKAVSVGEWKQVPLDKLAETLIALPPEAWPYGRVVGVMESGIRGLNENEYIELNRTQTEKILKSLGLTVDWWPSS